MGSEQQRFPQQERRKRWGCLGALSCFGKQKGGKRIVPASRMTEGNGTAAQQNGAQATGMTNQATAIALSLLAPPSSPASFTNSALPSTAQSPNCFLSLSANSPGGPSSAMFATGPYANDMQLVSPPVFSTFTTEPSTAPFTPPPELAHLTTPSSPDVPFARFLTSSVDLKSNNKTGYIPTNDLQAAYSLYPGSPASSLRSPASRTSGDGLSSSFPAHEYTPQWEPSVSPQNGKCSRTDSGNMLVSDTVGPPLASRDSNFFCPATFAQFYLDHDSPFPLTGGRLSVSKDSEVYSASANGHQNWQTKGPKQDVEEHEEAYRASFGFSADDIITTAQYVEITDVMDDSFTISSFSSDKKGAVPASLSEGQKVKTAQTNLLGQSSWKSESDQSNRGIDCEVPKSSNVYKDHKSRSQAGYVFGSSTSGIQIHSDEKELLLKAGSLKNSRKYNAGMSSSDAEIDYRRGRSIREGRGGFFMA